MAPALLLRDTMPVQPSVRIVAEGWPGTRETQPTRRHGHFGLKSAPQHRDFRPGKEGDSK